jgi:hypothetical protein
VTSAAKLTEKVRSFILSDENTPIIGDFCRTVCAMKEYDTVNGPREDVSAMMTWLSRYDKSVQYPNDAADWMVSYTSQILPEFNYNKFLLWLASCHTYVDVLNPPMFMEPPEAKSKVPVVVDGELIPHNCDIPDEKERPSRNVIRGPVKPYLGRAFPFYDCELDVKHPAPVQDNKYGSRIPVLKNTQQYKSNLPFNAAREAAKTRKQQNGTWVERETPEQYKARHIKLGDWVEPRNTARQPRSG